MKKTTYKVTRFDVSDDYYVEVTPDVWPDGTSAVDFVLCKNRYGIKSLMFGLSLATCPESEWEDMIIANVDDYIAGFEEDMEFLETEPESKFCDNCVCDCKDNGANGIYEGIDIHNETVNKLQDLAESLTKTYPDVEETEVNEAFCELWGKIITSAIWLCCEANHEDGGGWCTTSDWHVMRDKDVEKD